MDHMINIENRKRMTVTRVVDVDAFDEGALWANLEEGGLEVTGEKLNVERLDLAEGILVVTGDIGSVAYTQKRKRERPVLLQRLRRGQGL